jgi:hypothetical protein
MIRPLSDLPHVMSAMGKAAAKADAESVKPMTLAVRTIVDRNGSRHHIKGKAGGPVQLGAKSSVRGDVGFVEGSPHGFWRIVEEGSSAHIIASRYKGTGDSRRRTSNRRRSVEAIFGNADKSFGGRSPIKLGGIGYKQYAFHPGHGSQGRPWRNSMTQSAPVAQRTMADTSTKLFTKAWTGK